MSNFRTFEVPWFFLLNHFTVYELCYDINSILFYYFFYSTRKRLLFTEKKKGKKQRTKKEKIFFVVLVEAWAVAACLPASPASPVTSTASSAAAAAASAAAVVKFLPADVVAASLARFFLVPDPLASSSTLVLFVVLSASSSLAYRWASIAEKPSMMYVATILYPSAEK
jgi:hypothetical protein